jgi:hypothetical protein
MNLMNKNGYVSIDFMVASMIILLTIPSIIAIIEDRISTANSIQEMGEAKTLTENIARKFEMVYSGGDGCSIIFKTPASISNSPYHLTVDSKGVYIRFKGKVGTVFLTPMSISHSPYRSELVLESNKIYIISNIKNKHHTSHIIVKKI